MVLQYLKDETIFLLYKNIIYCKNDRTL